MKTLFFISNYFLLFVNTTFSQSVCAFTNKIETPAVSKPTDAQSSFAGTCDIIRISWKGKNDQTYIINASYTDRITGVITPASPGSSVVCDNDFNCYATLPVKAGALVNWSVQAAEVIDGRTFHSYPLRGEYPGCDNAAIVTNVTNSKAPTLGITEKNGSIKNDLKVYPNPVTGELTINWSSEHTGSATITIMDISGKTVKKINVRKVSENNTNRVSVQTLTSGLYFLNVKTRDGKSITTKFVKD